MQPAHAPSQGAEQEVRAWVQAVYRRQFAFVWRSLRGLGVADTQLDDATQEVFIVLYRRRHDYTEDRTERGWLFRIACFVARNHQRAHRRKGGSHLPLHEELVSQGDTPHDALQRQEATALLLRFLESLDDDQRNSFVAVQVLGLTTREAAEALQAKPNTVSSRLRLSRRRWEHFLRSHSAGTAEGGDEV